MMKLRQSVLFLTCVLFAAQANAQQQTLRHTFTWADAAFTFRHGSEITEQWSFEGAVFADAAPSHPQWIYTYPVPGAGSITVQVQGQTLSPLAKTPAREDASLGEQLRINTSVFCGPEGCFAKISLVPIIKNGQSYQRVDQLVLQSTFVRKGSSRGGPPFNSVLNEGDIYKIAVKESGIHRINYDLLKTQIGLSNLDNIDPRSIRVYGIRGGLVPYDINTARPEDLVEIPIRIVGEEDGRFNNGDVLLFYAEGPHRWIYNNDTDEYRQERNIYDSANYYFIKVGVGNGLRISARESTNAATTAQGYDGLFRYEQDLLNALHDIEEIGTGTGQAWYSDFFKFARQKEFRSLFNLENLQTNEPVVVTAEMALRATVSSRFYLEINGQRLQSGTAASVNIGSATEYNNILAPTARLRTSINLNDPDVDVLVDYPNPGGTAQSMAWLDFIQLRPRLNLAMTSAAQLSFRDSRTRMEPAVGYALANAGSDVEIWDITNPLSPIRQNTASLGNTQQFGAAAAGTMREFVAFRNTAALLVPEAAGAVANQNLHALEGQDLLIVYHPAFESAALRLAEHRRTFSGFDVVAASTTQVYNEFSGGRAEPTAIRDFAHTLFNRESGLHYLLLIGDGSFDARNVYGLDSNYVPVYERDLNHEILGYPADDFFGIFNTNPGSDPLSGDLSISIGRLPVKSVLEADAVVNKIIRYDTDRTGMADWRTRFTFLGDDEDGGTHSNDSDEAAELVRDLRPQFNDAKLFFDLTPQEANPGGDRFPLIQEELERAIFRGTAITTYLGHGGPRGWAQERVLDIPMIQNMDNLDKLSVFLTATCTFGNFDDAAFVSAGEELILNPRGGAIALLTTTRPVYASRNSRLTNATLTGLLRQDSTSGQWSSMGDAIRLAKNALSTAGNFDNERKFMIMGDPSQRVALPRFKVETTSINGIAPDTAAMDTLRALETITVTGRVTDLYGNLMGNFNGTVYPTVYDKRVDAQTLGNDSGSPILNYAVQRNVLFRGQATVQNGEFTFRFVMPKDINYAYGQGKISYYAADIEQFIDAGGFEDRFIIGGSGAGLGDDEAPLVDVFMNSEDFIMGGTVDADPVLVVKLSDDLGINVAGNSIGHDLEGFLNEDTRNSYLLNDFYQAENNDFTKGEVRFPLKGLAPGKYTMRVRAWDTANNMGEGSTEFIVAGDGKVALEHVLNYPNPFTTHTCFQFDSSLAGEDVEVLINIYTVSGRKVKTLEALVPAADGALRLDDCIPWDGLDDYGDTLARGVYLYKVQVRSSLQPDVKGESDFEKLVILR